VKQFCEQHVPRDQRDQLRLECSVRGNSITLLERRPPWSELIGSDWTSMKIAQLRYDAADRSWTLYCADRNERWWPYDFAEPSAGIDELLAAIDEDPTGIFWG
jgi:Protein of unknown function (DUF3024)